MLIEGIFKLKVTIYVRQIIHQVSMNIVLLDYMLVLKY